MAMKESTKQKTSIRKKTAKVIFVISLFALSIGISLGYFQAFELLKDTIGKEHLSMAGLLTSAIGRILNEEIADLEIFMSHPGRKSQIEKSNSKYKGMSRDEIEIYFEGMDEKWSVADDKDLIISEYLNSSASERLKTIARSDSGIAEIFMTDKSGGLVASSGKTSDFYQGDETWWKKAFNDGKGNVYISNIEFDESIKVLSLTVAIPVYDDLGNVIGVCKAVLDVKRLFEPLESFRIGKTGHAVLINAGGYIIYHEEIEPLSARHLNEEDFARITLGDKKWLVAKLPHLHEEKMFIAYVPATNRYFLKEGIRWWVSVDQEADEVFAPLRKLVLQAIVLGLVIIIIIVVIGTVVSGIFVKPIRKLHEATERVAKGDLEYKVEIHTGDEIEEFADSFNIMVAKLKKSTTSIEHLNKEIFDRRKAEEKLQKANEELKKLDELKSDFISVVSHELRTPLSIIKEGISLVLDEVPGKLKGEQKKILNMSKDNIDRLARIINDLLDMSKIEAGRMELKKVPLDLSRAVKDACAKWKLESDRKKQKLLISAPDSPINIYADPDKLDQVINNLILNAITYTPEKGRIKVELKDKNQTAEVSVSDTGIGIAKEDLPKVFDKFQQFGRKAGPGAKGTGLGLAIVKQLVEMHGGNIKVESEINRGSKFTFSLLKDKAKE